MVDKGQLNNIKQFSRGVEDFQFVEKQDLKDKRSFIFSIVIGIDISNNKDLKTAEKCIKGWSEGALNMICSDYGLIDQFKEFIEGEEFFLKFNRKNKDLRNK